MDPREPREDRCLHRAAPRAPERRAAELTPLHPLAELLECPRCRAALSAADETVSCARCGATYPVVDGIAAFQERHDAYAANYDRIAADDLVEPKTPSVVKEIFAGLVLERARGVVCDLGCGDGYVIRRVRSDSRIAVDIARAYLERLPAEILRLWARVEAVPLASGSIDTVVCTDVIEHVVDAASVAREIDRLAAPDAAVLLAFPFEQDLAVYELPEYKAKYGKYDFVHLRSVDDETIATLFPRFVVAAERLITEGMHLMEFKPFPIKFVELRRA